jgi:hypothetical protein
MNSSHVLRALLVLAVVVASCRSSGTSSNADEPYRTLLYGYHSGLKPGHLRVARDEAELDELWSEHTSPMMPKPDAPTVDWSKEMVVFIALGERPTGGYGVVIDHVAVEKGHLIVDAIERKPAPDAVLPQVITRPYVIAATPRVDGEVELRMH